MKIPFRACFAVFSSAVCAAAGLALRGGGRAQPPLRIAWPVMGTEAAVICLQPARAAAVDAARETVQRTFERFEAALSAWDGASELSRINGLAGTGRKFKAGGETLRVCRAAKELAVLSGGAFNPLVCPAMKLYGFNGADGTQTFPDRKALDAIPADPADIEISAGGEISLAKAGMKLDLGGIAKGAAVDAAFEALVRAGLDGGAMVDLGGNLRAGGAGPAEGGGWEVAVRDPFSKGASAARIRLEPGEAVATSGNYERFRTVGGKRVSHILDGRTRLPSSGVAGCTIVAGDAMTADGLSTALFILGPEDGARFLKDGGISASALWIPDSPESREIIVNGAMARRLAESAEGWRVRRLP